MLVITYLFNNDSSEAVGYENYRSFGHLICQFYVIRRIQRGTLGWSSSTAFINMFASIFKHASGSRALHDSVLSLYFQLRMRDL